MRRSTHHDARTVAWDGWGLIVDTRVHMESKNQWTAVFACVMHVMLVRPFGLRLSRHVFSYVFSYLFSYVFSIIYVENSTCNTRFRKVCHLASFS